MLGFVSVSFLFLGWLFFLADRVLPVPLFMCKLLFNYMWVGSVFAGQMGMQSYQLNRRQLSLFLVQDLHLVIVSSIAFVNTELVLL